MPPRNATQASSPDLTGDDAPLAADTTAIAAGAAAAGGIRPIDSPAARPRDGKRAPVRGVYEDREGDRRVVGAGDVIPDGWTLVEETDLAARAAGTPTAQDDDAATRTAGGGVDEDTHARAVEQLETARTRRDEEAQRADDAEARVADLEAQVSALEAQVAEANTAREAAEAQVADAAAAKAKGSAKS